MPGILNFGNHISAKRLTSAIYSAALLSLVLSTVVTISAARCAESNLVERPKRPLFIALTLNTMSAPLREVAEEMEIMPLLKEIYDGEHPPTPDRKFLLREKIQETILECYLDAASVIAECDRETVYLEAQRENMISKRDRAVEYNNATNFIASGSLNTIGSILGFSGKTPPFPGNLNQMLSGVVSATMSTYALHQNIGSKVRRPERPTMLAELFGRPLNVRTRYPESVWRFLHGQSIDQPELTRLQVLEKNWILRQHLEKHGAKREQEKINLVCGVATTKKIMSLDDLSDEIAMISDVSAVSDLLVHHLRDLQRMIDSDVLQ